MPIEHIIVLMQENHSFDSYFGRLNDPLFYGSQLDGLHPSMNNLDPQGKPTRVYHELRLCTPDPRHDWDILHINWNQGKNDGFMLRNTNSVMGFYQQQDLPIYYALASQFAIADRYFSSVLTDTLPNRFFLMTGTAFGRTSSALPAALKPAHQTTIFEILNQHRISWKYYEDGPGFLTFFVKFFLKNQDKIKPIADFDEDLALGTLPQVVFIDTSYCGRNEHPSSNVQAGESFVGDRIRALMDSPYWKDSVFFLTYDESGGFFDHVPPPKACWPDKTPPKLPPGAYPGDYDRYGFRVPFIAISPFAKHHYVSHRIYDHTSILKFIETKFNLPALTARDANADPLMDLFDFENPVWSPGYIPFGMPDPRRQCR